jgi:hypothetical protein
LLNDFSISFITDNLNVIYLMAVGIGITHVASLSYIAVRTTKHERSARVALSYFAFFLGVGVFLNFLADK